jgi:hypothetical protein
MRVIIQIRFIGNYDDDNHTSSLDPVETFSQLSGFVSTAISSLGRVWFLATLTRSNSIGPVFISLSLIQLTPFFGSYAYFDRGEFVWLRQDSTKTERANLQLVSGGRQMPSTYECGP